MNAPRPNKPFALLEPWLATAAVQSGISFESGMRRCLWRVTLYDRIARRFMDLRKDAPQHLQAALDAGDREVLHRLSHDLASTAGSLGADALSATARALQIAIDEGAAPDHLGALVQLFSREHAVVLYALAAYVRGEVDLQAVAARKV